MARLIARDWYRRGRRGSGLHRAVSARSDIVYAADYAGLITRFDKRTGQLRNITDQPDLTDAGGAAQSGASLPVDCADDDFAE